MKVAVRKWKQLFAYHCKTESKSSEQQTGPAPRAGETISEVTVRSSYAIIGRSDTHFTVPYTGGFTDIGSTTANTLTLDVEVYRHIYMYKKMEDQVKLASPHLTSNI